MCGSNRISERSLRSIKSVRPALLIRRDGNELYIESTAAPIRDPAGAVTGGVLVFHDVSESRELNRRLSYAASHDVLPSWSIGASSISDSSVRRDAAASPSSYWLLAMLSSASGTFALSGYAAISWRCDAIALR